MWFRLHRCDPDHTGPVTIAHEATLPAPPEVVWDVLVDEESWPRWFPEVVRSRWLTPEPHGVGSLRRVDLRGGASLVEHFTVFRPGERMTFYFERATAPVLRHGVEDYRLTPAPGGGTRLAWRVHYAVRRPLRPLHPFARPLVNRLFATGIRNLAAFVAIEQTGEASGP